MGSPGRFILMGFVTTFVVLASSLVGLELYYGGKQDSPKLYQELCDLKEKTQEIEK